MSEELGGWNNTSWTVAGLTVGECGCAGILSNATSEQLQQIRDLVANESISVMDAITQVIG